MNEGDRVNPFTPGFGSQVPPVVAGRGREKRELAYAIESVVRGGHNARDVALVGPRGMGKTTMLNWFSAHIESEKKAGRILSKVRTIGPIAEIGGDGDPNRLFRKRTLASRFGKVSLGTRVASASFDIKDDSYFSEIRTIVAETRESPLVLLIDEAHELMPEQLRKIFHITQDARNDKASVIAVLAGTPDLKSTLELARVTFAERGSYIDIGLIDRDAAEMAIRDPLKDIGGINLKGNAIDAVLNDAQDYPYFVQLWGQQLWRVAKENGKSELDIEDVEKCAPKVAGERLKLYAKKFERWGAIEERMFLAAVSSKVKDGLRVGKEALVELGKDYLKSQGQDPDNSEKYVDKMIKEGVVWKREEDEVYGPGMPSFLGYITGRAERVEKELAETKGLAH